MDGFNIDAVNEMIDGSSLGALEKTALKGAVDQVKDNPELLQGALDKVKQALGL